MKRRILLIEIGPKLFLTGVLPSAALNSAYNASVSARGGSAPYRYEVIDGALPDGWALEPFSGMIAGTTDAPGLYTFTVQVTDARGATARKTFSVRVQAEPVQIIGAYPDGTVGTAYSADLVISGGMPPYSNPRLAEGTLPPGLALSIVDDKLRLSGTPTAAFDAGFTVAAADSNGLGAESVQSLKIAQQTSPPDPYWSNVVALLHFDGPDGSSSFTDETGIIWSPYDPGHGYISNAKAKFGESSGFFTRDISCPISTPGSAKLVMGTGDFTIEGWFLPGPGDPDYGYGGFFVSGFNTPDGMTIFMNNTGIMFRCGAGDFHVSINITGWSHFVLQRKSGVVSMYLNGAQIFSELISFDHQYGDGINLGSYIGDAGFSYDGYIDEFRMTKGVARYSGTSFPVPTAPFSNHA